MANKVHIFVVESWFKQVRPVEGWDYEGEYLVLQPGLAPEHRTYGAAAPCWANKLRKEFPGAEWHQEPITLKRGVLEEASLKLLDEAVASLLRELFMSK